MAKRRAGFSIRVDGVKELEEILGELAPKVRVEVEKTALRQIAKEVKEDVEERAPKGATGQLSQSFKVRAMRRKKGRVGLQVATSKGWFKGKTFYGAFQEFGWKAGKRWTGPRREAKERTDKRRQVEGKHFVEKAYEAAKPDFLAKMRDALIPAVESVAKRLARKSIRKASQR